MIDDATCVSMGTKEYVDSRIGDLEKQMHLELKAIHAEYQKSEGNYPTREQLDQAMRGYCTTVEAKRLGRNQEIQTGVIISIFLLFVGTVLSVLLRFGGG